MATETAPAPPASPPRNYWQLPTFLLGAAAMAAAWTYTPAPVANPGAVFRGTLDALAQAVERRPADVPAVEGLTRRVVEMADQFPDAADEAQFLAGSGYLVLAVYGPAEDAADAWKLADQHFARCRAAGLSEADAKKFAFRSAEANAAVGGNDPAAILVALNQPPPGEDTAETPRLVAATCLRQTPPDLKRARDELARYLALPNTATPAQAARYKLDLAGLYLTLNEPEPARRWLKDIGTGAPPDVLVAARVRLARLAVADGSWAEAVKVLEAAQATPGLPDDQKGRLRYQTGFAFLQMGNPSRARQHLEEAAREPGPVGAAAAVRMAELRVRDAGSKGNRADAAEWLEKAAAGVKGAADFAAADVSPAEARAAFEEVIKRATLEGDYQTAVRAATAYAVVAEGGKERERRAEAAAAWAAALEATDPAAAKAKHRMAGEDYAAVAAAAAAGRAELLRRAATQLKQGGATAAALDAVTRLLAEKDLPPEEAGRAWLDKADLLPAADEAGVTAALTRAMEAAGPAAAAARLRLAVAQLVRGKTLLDTAGAATDPAAAAARKQGEQMTRLGRDMLVQLADAAAVPPAEQATHEEALFQLGSRLMGEGQFADADARFRKQLQLYPDGKWAGFGRLWLACCLLQQAVRTKDPDPADKRLQEAIEQLRPLLASPVEFLRAHAEIRTLNVLVVQKQYDAVLTLGKDLSAKYAGRANELVIGRLMFYAHLNRTPFEPGEALKVLLRMEEVFRQLTPADFPTDPEYSRDRWEKQLPEMRQELARRKEQDQRKG